ncbi:ABC transporter ATP-binding protein [Nocardiopsis sp. M1B1]|uniref:ABC transporter ATP-binding protein n=1 Tax=Nocardiopsis sp. M1B1 TaxID=3450454 RepID=UPI004039AFAE
MIYIERISKSFGRRTLWSDLDLTIPSGQMTAFVGPSGSGKSTLLNCIGLPETVDTGRIVFKEKDLTRLSASGRRRFRRDNLGYLFQNYALVENATVAANLDITKNAGSRLALRRRIDYREVLEHVGLAGRSKEKVHHLSGGEQQRVALARLTVKRPAIVLADEPTGALDEANTRMVINVLREMSNQGCAVVIATHDDRVRDSCDETFSVDTREMSSAPAFD